MQTLSGSRGDVRDGRYIIADPRTSFRLPEDTKIVVYFEWLGPAGRHQIAGTWRGPNNTSTTSSFEYVAKETRFSAYWELNLPPTIPTGPWTLEATIDGSPAGTHAFEIGGADAPKPVATPVRVPLTRQEVFAKVLRAAVVVEGLDATGGRLSIGPGTVLDPESVATSFSLINNASRVRIRLADGSTVESSSAVAWNRRQDWIVFSTGALTGTETAAFAATDARPGDACYAVGINPEGMLAAAACEVVGTSQSPADGPRISVSYFAVGGAPGAPVLNEYGELVGLMNERLLDQVESRRVFRLGDVTSTPGTGAIPIALVKSDRAAAPTPLSVLAERGLFVPPVTHTRHVLSGGFATSVPARGAGTQPVDQRTEFQTSDKTMTLFVTWNPAERLKAMTTFRIHNLDNQVLGESKPMKLSLRVRDVVMTNWSMNVPPPGVYRVDVLLDRDIAWRGYFRVK